MDYVIQLNRLINKLKDAQESEHNFIYCEKNQSVPDAIEGGQFAKTGTEADQLSGDGNTQLITDWIKDLESELKNRN
jgi:hypothetical protein